MAEVQEGGRGSLLTRLQAADLIKVNDKIVYRGSESQEYEGTIVLGDDNAVFVKHASDLLKNEAAFVRKATGDAAIPKNFKNALTIGGRAFRDIQDEYKKLHPRAERPPRAAAAAPADGAAAPRAAGARRARRPNVRLGQLVSSAKIAVGEVAWFESKAGRIDGALAERERRYGFEWNGEFYPTPAAFIRAAEENRGVAEADRHEGKWDHVLHVGTATLRELREKYLAERPAPEPKPASTSGSVASSSDAEQLLTQLKQVRDQIIKLKEKEKDLLVRIGGARPAGSRRGRGRGPRRGRRALKGEESAAGAQ